MRLLKYGILPGLRRLAGAQLVAWAVIRALEVGEDAARALEVAKEQLESSHWRRILQRRATEDALAFRLWRPVDDDEEVRV